MTILAIDIGTSSMKMGVFRVGSKGDLEEVQSCAISYTVNVYSRGTFGDIRQELWLDALVKGCKTLADFMGDVDVVTLSGTTPGLSAMDANGNPTYPAILMFDQRSRVQAAEIIRTMGIEKVLAETANMPVAGGCSLASILWIKEHEPDAYRKAACFGHSNTFVAKWLTGFFAIDPSSASLSALYNTAKNDMTWNHDIASAFGLGLEQLPKVISSHESVGRIRNEQAALLGLSKRPPVLIGGNDAVLAAYDAGVQSPGQAINVNGTSEISLVCLSTCHPSTEYNIRAHVLPGRWLTLYVMNAGGKALEWFHAVFCSEMTAASFWSDFVPRALDDWLQKKSEVDYVPFLMGSRYSLEPLKAEFTGMNQETRREELFAALVRGLCEYQKRHLETISSVVDLSDTIFITGGALNDSLVRSKKRWMRDCKYVYREQSSLRGAARLALRYFGDI